MLNYLSYLYLSYLYPQYRDFSSMGIGIKYRFKRFNGEWQEHLKNSKELQSVAIKKIAEVSDSISLGVFGAGRLYDLNLEQLSNHKLELNLYDLDPGAKIEGERYLKKNFPQIRFIYHQLDLTGVIESWSNSLSEFFKSNSPNVNKLCDFLEQLPLNNNPLNNKKYDCIFSLNTLGQIPIYWRDRVYNYLQKYWSIAPDHNLKYPEDLEISLKANLVRLQNSHLGLIFNSAKKLVLITTDIKYNYYDSKTNSTLTEDSLYIELLDSTNEFKMVEEKKWSWHISPQNSETRDYGERNDVLGLIFER